MFLAIKSKNYAKRCLNLWYPLIVFDQCAILASAAPYKAGNFIKYLAISIEQNQQETSKNLDGSQLGLF